MLEYIKANIGEVSAYLEKQSNGKWTKQIRAPDYPGECKVMLELKLSDGSVILHEADHNISVISKGLELHYDLGIYGKLNEELIKRIVFTCSGHASHVLFEDGYIRVLIRAGINFKAILRGIKELLLFKMPAHLSLSVEKYFISWDEVKRYFCSCSNILATLDTWEDIYCYVPKHFICWRDIRYEFTSWADVSGKFADWHSVCNYRSKDYAIWNEIRTGSFTWNDVARKYENWDAVQLYTPVEMLKEVY